MLLPVQEIALVLVFVGIDYLPLVGSLVVYPLSVIDCPRNILQDSVSVFLVFDPFSNVLVTIAVIVSALAVFLSTQPATLVPLILEVEVHSESRLLVLHPFSIIHCTSLVFVHPPAVLPPL